MSTKGRIIPPTGTPRTSTSKTTRTFWPKTSKISPTPPASRRWPEARRAAKLALQRHRGQALEHRRRSQRQRGHFRPRHQPSTRPVRVRPEPVRPRRDRRRHPRQPSHDGGALQPAWHGRLDARAARPRQRSQLGAGDDRAGTDDRRDQSGVQSGVADGANQHSDLRRPGGRSSEPTGGAKTRRGGGAGGRHSGGIRMSNVGDALSGSGSSASGVNDQTFADATLGDQMQGGTGDFTGGDAGGGPTEFNQFSDVANALSSGTPAGASPTVAQSVAMNPPSAAASTGGDPVGAASGTQSSTTPGSSPADQNQQQQTGQTKNQQDQNQYAPKSATDQLKALLKQLSGKPTGPTGPTVPAAPAAPFALPTLAAGQTGPQSALRQLVGSQPAGASLEVGQTGPQSPGPGAGFAGSQPGGSADIPAEVPGDDELKFDPKTGTYTPQPGMVRTDDQGNPITAAGTRADQTPLPPPRPAGAQTAQAPGAAGRDITVQPKGGMPWPQKEPGEVAPGGPALPTRKPTQPPEAEQPAAPAPAPAPAPTQGAAPRLLQDISGASTGSPTALADLAQAARIILPLVGMFMGGGRGRRGGG